jgi:uncharacterized RmlC-like cupin family protein
MAFGTVMRQLKTINHHHGKYNISVYIVSGMQPEFES